MDCVQVHCHVVWQQSWAPSNVRCSETVKLLTMLMCKRISGCKCERNYFSCSIFVIVVVKKVTAAKFLLARLFFVSHVKKQRLCVDKYFVNWLGYYVTLDCLIESVCIYGGCCAELLEFPSFIHEVLKCLHVCSCSHQTQRQWYWSASDANALYRCYCYYYR